MPEFSARIYIDNLIKYSPSFIAGVPTLFFYDGRMTSPYHTRQDTAGCAPDLPRAMMMA